MIFLKVSLTIFSYQIQFLCIYEFDDAVLEPEGLGNNQNCCWEKKAGQKLFFPYISPPEHPQLFCSYPHINSLNTQIKMQSFYWRFL